MSSTFRQWKNRLQRSNKRNTHQSDLPIANELKNVSDAKDILLNENRLLIARIDKLEERYQQWTNNEQTYLLKRIEKLENENRQLHQLFQTYQMQNETCIRSITDLIMKIILTQQELRKQRTERHNEDDVTQWRKKQQQIETDARNTPGHVSSIQLDDSRHVTNDQTTWLHQRLMNDEEHDQETTNHLLELNNQSSTLATVKSKSDKSSASSTNKLYLVLSNEKTPRENRRLPGVNIVPADDSNIRPPHKKPPSSSTVTFNKNQPTRTAYSNHERLPKQTSSRKNTPTKTAATPTISKPSRTPATTVRPPATNIRQRPLVPSTTNQKTNSSSSITNNSARPRYTLAKASEPVRSVGATTTTRPSLRQTAANKPNITVTKTTANNIKTRIPIVVQQSARVSDLDTLMAEQQNKITSKLSDKPTTVSPPPITNNIQHSLFSKDSVKLVRPIRSQDLKLFSCHLTPEILTLIPDQISFQTNESLSTLTPPSLESITDNKSTENKNDYSNSSSNVTSITRDFSEDSLNEHYHIQKLLKQNASINATKYNNNNKRDHLSNDTVQTSSGSDISPLKPATSTDSAYCNGSIEQENKETNTKEGYFLVTDDNLSSQRSQLSLSTASKGISSSTKSLVHRLVFPARLGRMIFYRRILSDSDIYQKNCSKDNEIYHNVYHLDTVRDYSMEFYMITTYASDSQLRAWIDSNDDEIVNNVCQFDENRFQLDDDDDDDENHMKKLNSSDSLIEDELDWYSELDVLNLSSANQQDKQETTSSCSSKVHVEELLRTELFSLSSPTTTTSADSSSSTGVTSNSWAVPKKTSNQVHSTPVPYNITDPSNSILREILNHSWTDDGTTANSIQDETNFDQYENESTSSIITDEFQSDFYYLCPVTNTTNFSKTDHKTLFHDV